MASQVDVWLELVTDDPDKALTTLDSPNRDEFEPFEDVMERMKAQWTSDLARVVLFVRAE